MKFSVLGESLLKKALRAESLEEEYKKTIESASDIENGLKQTFSSQYSALVTKYGSLDELKDALRNVQMDNINFKNAIEELSSIEEGAETQLKILKTALERINILQNDLGNIKAFLLKSKESEAILSKMFERAEPVKAEEMFKLSQNVIFLQKNIQLFQKYGFYSVLDGIRINIIDQTKKIVFEEIDGFLKMDFKDGFGRHEKYEMFDDIQIMYKKIIGQRMQDVFYFVKHLAIVEEVIEYINKQRIERFKSHGIDILDCTHNNSDTSQPKSNPNFGSEINDQLQTFMADIFTSFFLSFDLPQINPFYNEIFYKLQFCNVCDLTDISKLKRIVKNFNIQSSVFDDFIENAVFKSFNVKPKDERFKDDISGFLEDSFKFLDEINDLNNEYDEMLLKHVDNAMISYLERADYRNIFDRESVIDEIIEKIKKRDTFCADYIFEVEQEMKNRNSRLLQTKVDEFKKSVSETSEMPEIIEMIVDIKKISNEEFRKGFALKLAEAVDEIIPKKTSDEKTLFVDTINRNILEN